MTTEQISKQQSEQILSRKQRKKLLRDNLFQDKLAHHSILYKNDPFRFKCLMIHNQEPFVAETPGDILSQNFYTPNDLFFVVNHGPVPKIKVEEFCLYILGMVNKPVRLTIKELKKNFQSVTISATLKCAANRKQEFDKINFIDQNQSYNDKFGAGAIGTAVWTGIRLRDVLQLADIEFGKALNAEFYGDDVIHGTEKQNYSITLPIKKCMNKKSDIILAYEMNGEPLHKDHGYPLRLICPGMIGAKSVKWLSRIMIIDSESPAQFQHRDFKLFPSNINSVSVSKLWSEYPSLTYFNVDCAFTNIQDGDFVPQDRRFVIKGYAISGQGNLITRVEISFNSGSTWQQCKLTCFKDKKAIQTDQSSGKWDWTTWEYAADKGLQQETVCMVRAFDECCNTQPKYLEQIWNFKGYMNNSIQKIVLKPMKAEKNRF